MHFDLIHTDGQARRVRLNFPCGTVETPAFIPVGTYGTVKAMTLEELQDLGAEIILGNTFILVDPYRKQTPQKGWLIHEERHEVLLN